MNGEHFRFVREMIHLRKRHSALRRRTFFHGRDPARGLGADVAWHGAWPGKPDFSGASRTLALSFDGAQTGREPDEDFYIAFNAWDKPLTFWIPASPSGRRWRRVVDTYLPSPEDIVEEATGEVIEPMTGYRVGPFSLVVLITGNS
jgi:glycogen operon protein